MASVMRESIGELHDKLIVSMNKDDYYPSFEKSLKQYGKTANIAGFRKGMVPSGMIRKMYGQSVFAEEVIRSAYKHLNAYLETNKPSIFAQPLAIQNPDLRLDMDKTNEVKIGFEIGLKPDFEVTTLKEKGKLTRYIIAVDDKLLKKETENLQHRTGKLEDSELPEEPSDIVYGTYIACDEKGNVTEGAEPVEDTVVLENLPKKIGEVVNGQKAGFTYIFKPSEACTKESLEEFLTVALKKDLSHKDNYFKFTLTKSARLVPSELNEAFFKKVFPNEEIKDAEAFNKRLKEELEKEAARAGKDRIENELFETLVHSTEMKLPVDFLKNWLKKGEEKQKTDDEVERELPDFLHRLRWTLISDKLTKDMKIEVSNEEIKEDMKQKVMVYFGMKAEEDAPWIEDYLERMTKDQKTMEETHARLLFDKLFQRVAIEMEVKTETVDEETFAKIAVNHHHH